ncbi:MAG: imidazole glycerol phosphate synthase subunit HisF, partial [Desulfobacteraceae bacterium]
IKIFNEKEVDEIIVLDIGATIGDRPPSMELISEISNECFMPMCYGGGVRTLDQIEGIIRAGIEKVAVNTQAHLEPAFVTAAADRFGSQSIVVSMDVKRSFLGKYSVVVRGGRLDTRIDPVEYARRMERYGAGEILLTAVDRDGTWVGYDLPLVRMVSEAVSIPVIACGGAGSVADFGRAVRESGASAVAAGSLVVYQQKGLGVLIGFPERKALEKVLIEEVGS